MATIFSRYIDIPRRGASYQLPDERVSHFSEFTIPLSLEDHVDQARRCMTCGVPFCHNVGCPLGNPIPETNGLIAEGRWREACDLFHVYNNFPEFTARLCPAPCEAACVQAINADAVTIRDLEYELVEHGWREGWIVPIKPEMPTDKKVAIVGSGPAGLAAAQQLIRAGHEVTVFEKAPLPGGILRYGIPDFKLDKSILSRRLRQMTEEGVVFRTGVSIGSDISIQYIHKNYDAIILAGGATEPRNLDIPGRNIEGIHFAMDFLIVANETVEESGRGRIDAQGKAVIVIGGGDTGADCLGVALRQGAKSVTQIEIMPKPPECRDPETPWPRWPNMLRTGTSHKEGGTRRWGVLTKRFLSENNQVTGMECVDVDWINGKSVERPESGFRLDADLVLLALGFLHPKHDALLDDLNVDLDSPGNVRVDAETMMTNVPGVFSAGDMQCGASLVVRAIAGGRNAARGADLYLMGQTDLPGIEPVSLR